MNGEIALPSGYALKEYRIESTLGVGGFGLTYLATDSNLHMQVAIKEYLPADLALRCDDQSVRSRSDSTEPRFAWGRARFLDESRVLASFRHPNIVRVLRFFEANQTAYMVMEFVAGQPLDQWITTRRPLADETLMRLALALLDGIEVIHRAGYLHRDVKPSNIFIRGDGNPVLLDFGSARADVDTERTAIVSPGYAPLEQYHAHGNQGPWSDLYALGAVLHWAVTGHKPVEATARVPDDSMPSAIRAVKDARYSQHMLRTIDWALKPAETLRPQSVDEMRRALVVDGESPTAYARTIFVDKTEIPQTAATHAHQPLGVDFDSQTLKEMSADLAAYLGPVAGVVVKAAAKRAVSRAQLAATLAVDIGDAAARARFLKKYATAHGAAAVVRGARSDHTGSGPSTSGPASRPVDAATLEMAEVELARYIGAVAKPFVRRAAARSRSDRELFTLLADEIDDPDARKAFLRKLMSVSGRV